MSDIPFSLLVPTLLKNNIKISLNGGVVRTIQIVKPDEASRN